MLNPKIQDAFNKQLGAELFSAHLYLSLSSWFEAENLKGMARWMRAQAQEETRHAMKFFDFINARSGRALLAGVEGPKTQWNSPLEAFEDAYKHELKVSGLINDLVNLTLAEKDHAAGVFLQWFVNEQVEEEASVLLVVEKLKLAGDSGVALFMLDNELGQRTASAPGAAAE